MKFLKALGIGFLADILAMLISVIIIIACLALKASWLSLIISFFAVPALIIALYFHYRKKAESKAYYWPGKSIFKILNREKTILCLNYNNYLYIFPAVRRGRYTETSSLCKN